MTNKIVYSCLGIVLFFVFFFRVNSAHSIIFQEDKEVRLIGIDPYFYLRHVETTFQNFPQLQKWDHATHFPNGTAAEATGLHTIFMAGICKLFLSNEATDNDIAAIIAWISPVFSVLAFLLVFLIMRKLRDAWLGLFACVLLLFIPGKSLPRGLLGFPDHHIFEIVLSLALCYALIKLISPDQKKANYLKIFFCSLPLVLFFFVWSGAPLYLVLSVATLCSYAVFADYNKNEAIALAKRIFLFFFFSAIFYGIVFLLWPDLITLAEKDHQSSIFFILLLSSFFVPAILFIGSLKSKFNVFFVKTVGILIGTIITYLLLIYTSYGQEFLHYFNYTFEGLVENEKVDTLSFWFYTNSIGLISYIGILYFLLSSLLSTNRFTSFPLLVFTLFFTFFWMNTYDMGYLINPMMAMVAALFLAEITQWMIKKFKNIQWFQIPWMTPVFYLILSGVMIILPRASSSVYNYQFSSADLEPSIQYNEAIRDAMGWLKENTPEPNPPVGSIISQVSTPSAQDYGIMSSWDLGNIIAQKAKRKPVWSRYPSTRTAEWFAHVDENEAFESLCPGCKYGQRIRYIVVDANMASSFFMAKYGLIGKNIQDCLALEEVTEEGQKISLPTLGDCYHKSMVNQLYRYNAQNLSRFKKIYESPQKSLIASIYDGNQLILFNKPVEQVDPRILEYAGNEHVFNTDEGYLNDTSVGGSVKIFEVLY